MARKPKKKEGISPFSTGLTRTDREALEAAAKRMGVKPGTAARIAIQRMLQAEKTGVA